MTESPVKIALVVATDLDGVIGRDNALPWRLPADLARFRTITMGKPMIMGRRTWESIGRPLPGRHSIVLTRTREFAAPGAHVAPTPDAALALAMPLALAAPSPEIMVIGGAEVFRSFLPRADRIHWTQVLGRVEGDVRFPALDLGDWREIEREDRAADERNAFATRYRLLERIRRGVSSTP